MSYAVDEVVTQAMLILAKTMIITEYYLCNLSTKAMEIMMNKLIVSYEFLYLSYFTALCSHSPNHHMHQRRMKRALEWFKFQVKQSTRSRVVLISLEAMEIAMTVSYLVYSS